jgi:hypothetical protein
MDNKFVFKGPLAQIIQWNMGSFMVGVQKRKKILWFLKTNFYK